MAGCDSQTFNAVTAEQFACIAQKAQEESGLALSGNIGEASAQGITVRWNFDPVSQVLTIECTDKPFLLPCGTINSTIQNLVNSCLGS
jgi:hypothetical protein